MRKHLAIIIAVLLLLVAIFIIGRQNDSKVSQETKKAAPTSQSKNKSEDIDSKQFSLSESDSIWVVVNKHYQLTPKNYTPSNLINIKRVPYRSNITATEKQMRSDAATALAILVDVAKKQGVNFNLQSAYRSYDFQNSLYARYVKQKGQAEADTESARPGHSEHQTGLAADLGSIGNPSCDVEECFADTKEGKWLAANAYKHGFIIRYPKGKQEITGYKYEPWHIRYVGPQLAKQMQVQKIQTLEEFFGLEPAPDYN